MPVLDTTVLIDLIRSPNNPRHQRDAAIISQLVTLDEPVCTTRLNVAELWVGIELSKNPPLDIQAIETLLDAIVIIDFDSEAARSFGSVEAHLRRIGKPAGEIDTLIAAICIVHEQRLITHNAKHFANIPELVIESY